MAYLIAVIVFLLLLTLGAGSYVLAFIDLSALLMILPAIFLAMAMAPGSLWNGWRLALGIAGNAGNAPSSRRGEAARAAHGLAALGTMGLWLGGVGVLTGAVVALQFSDSPEKIGPALALAILSLLYALTLKVLCLGAEKRIAARHGLQD